MRTPNGSVHIPQASIVRIDSVPDAQTPAPTGTNTGGGPVDTGKVVRLAGSTTIGDELMPALIEQFAASENLTKAKWSGGSDPSEQDFDASGTSGSFAAHLSRHGSATAFTALADGKADVGMASRSVNADEAAKLEAAGLGNVTAIGQENVLALDGLVVLVNRANPVNSLSIADLGNIFSGQITDWGQVGGTAGPIHVFGRDAKSGSADTFKGLVMKDRKVTGDAKLIDSSDALSDAVASDPAAIGFAYTHRTKALSLMTDCGLETAPNDFFVRTEEYPLSRRLFLYTRPPAQLSPDTQHLIDFSLGKKGRTRLRRKASSICCPVYRSRATARLGSRPR